LFSNPVQAVRVLIFEMASDFALTYILDAIPKKSIVER